MLHWKSKLAVFGVVLLCAVPQCQSDDDPFTDSNGSGGAGGTGGVSAAGGADSAGGRGFIMGTGGVNPWLDAGPLCVENLPTYQADVDTYSAADLVSCVLSLRSNSNGGFVCLPISLYVDCVPNPADADDGGVNWTYSGKEQTVTFGDAMCDQLEADPTHRIDTGFAYCRVP